MAITYTKTPLNFSPVYNENYIRIIDSEAGADGYKYIIKVFMKQTSDASFTQIGNFTQFPLSDGTLEFDPNSVFNNYLLNNNFDYKLAGGIYRNSNFYGKVTIYRTTTSNPNEVLILNFDPLYVFDGSLVQSEMDDIAVIKARLMPTLPAKVLTPVISSYTITKHFTEPGWFSNLLKFEVFAGSTSNFTPGRIFTVTGYTGFSSILNKDYIITDSEYVSPGVVNVVVGDSPYPVGVHTIETATGTTLSDLLRYTENTVDRSLSNVNSNLKLTKFDYYTADYFRNIYGGSWPVTNIGMEVHHSGGWKWYNLNPVPINDGKVEHNIVTIPVAPMNIKALNWNGDSGLVSGAAIFALNDFTRYRVYVSTQDGAEYPTLSKPITVDLCSSNTPTNVKSFDRTWLCYKSKLGGWSWLLFNMKAAKNIDCINTTYNRRLKYNETYVNRGATVISSEITTKYTLNTDWVPTSEYTFYEDLFTSPQIYMVREYVNGVLNTNDPFNPVVLKNVKVPIYSPNNEKLFQHTIEVETANKNIRQR